MGDEENTAVDVHPLLTNGEVFITLPKADIPYAIRVQTLS